MKRINSMRAGYRPLNLIQPIFWIFLLLLCAINADKAWAASVEFNSTGGTTATNGLHFYIEDTTHIQVRRLNNTGQVYSPTSVPPSTGLDNGIFLRANGKVYGPGHDVTSFTPTGGMYNTFSIGATTPANPSTAGVQQTATNSFGINSGPQVTVIWKYTTPLDFLTAEVTLVIPAGYAVNAANPVRYYHIFDTYLGGNDNGCGVKFTDSNGKTVVGTYPPPTGTNCPSSTGLPAGVTIVESFRERNGRFSNYCSDGWFTFYVNGNPNCSVLQTAALSNTIVTTYQDTGIGIEYDFIAAGTYTFSYDFVIGSTTVPPYDHIEIQHDGGSTLCPDTVTVLACTSATVPCPALSVVNTGTLTGTLSTTPTTPAVTWSPSATFILGSSASTATPTIQAAAPGGSYTLFATGMSSVPLNGTKCWNTTTNTSSCSFVVANTPCVKDFECLEPGATYNNRTVTPAARNPLYTKLTATNFKFDVVALQASGATASSYTATQNVNVELFDDSASPQPACSAYANPVASQSITFSAADAGRKTVANNFNLTKAYRKLRCRVTDSNVTPATFGCSSDDFTVRPQSFSSVTSSSATADSTGSDTMQTPAIKAGAAFDLTANTGVVGYGGKPKVDTTKLEWFPTGAATSLGTGTVAGIFSTAAAPASGNGASGSAFTYDEVGYFRFLKQGVYDDDFTKAKSDNTTNDTASDANNGDCTDDFSNALVGGKYGCKFGNATATNHFGRFMPDHFSVVTPVTFTAGCVAGGFTYMDQPFNLAAVIEARNASNVKTQKYQAFTNGTYNATFANGVVSYQMENANDGTPIATARLTGLGTPAWTAGSYPFTATKFTRGANPDGPFDAFTIGISVADETALPANARPYLFNRDMDASNTSCIPDTTGTSNGTCPAVTVASTKMRFGRLKLSNAYGSELLNLPIPVRLEYWNGTAGGWLLNSADTCTTILASDFGFSFPSGLTNRPNNLAACETVATVAGTGAGMTVKLTGPGSGNNGWTDLALNLGPATPTAGSRCTTIGAAGSVPTTAARPWLMFNWKGVGTTNPSARATFGAAKAGPVIYLREMY